MSVMPTVRLADTGTAGGYPLPVQGRAHWQQRAEDDAWTVTVPLPALRPGMILLPSLTFSPEDASSRHQWTLFADDVRSALQEVPVRAPVPPDRTGTVVTTHIDCYHVHRHLEAPRLEVRLDAAQAPGRYLICVSARPLALADPPLPMRAAALQTPPRPRSQMTAPGAIASRICSPTCVSMVLDLWQRPHDWLEIVAECHDPASGMYGVWPLALAAAARRGSLGAVEAFDGWEEPLAVLERGVPLVTSIRFAPGELPGAPLDETGGHLVVVHGAGPQHVVVCDPAAPDGEVARSYPADAFSRAWLRHRGAAYILPP